MNRFRGIFISYRRSDSQDFTERIHDRLVTEFGDENVFLDVDKNIPPGVDYADHLTNVIEASGVVLAVIGPAWLDVREATDPQMRRLDNREDFVRREIEFALSDDSLVVIPLLVKGARMPAQEELPEGMRNLARRQAFPVQGNPYFHQEITELNGIIQGHLEAPRFGVDLESVEKEIREGLSYAMDSEELLAQRWRVLERFREAAKKLEDPEAAAGTARPEGLEQQMRLGERRSLERIFRRELTRLLEGMARLVVDSYTNDLKEQYRDDERAVAYLEEFVDDLVSRIEDLVGNERYSEYLSLDID